MGRRSALWLGVALAVATSSSAHAQDRYAVTVYEYDRAGPQLQIGGHLGIPTWWTDEDNFATTGVQLAGYVGLDLGYVMPFFRLGWQWHTIDVDPRYRDALYRTWFALGVRAEAHNRSIVSPYLEAALDFNWWSLSFDTEIVCGAYYCYEENVYRFAPGITGRAGAQIEVTPQFAFEAGIELAVSFEGDVFVDAQSWVSPFFGGTVFLY